MTRATRNGFEEEFSITFQFPHFSATILGIKISGRENQTKPT